MVKMHLILTAVFVAILAGGTVQGLPHEKKRFIVGDILHSILGDLRDGAEIAGCEATFNHDDCMSCCDHAAFSHADIEKPACHAACGLLHGKKRDADAASKKRFLVADILEGVVHGLQDGARLAGCEATLDASICATCCDNANFTHEAVELPACHAACGLLGKKRDADTTNKKRFLVADIIGDVVNGLKDGARLAGCEATLDVSICTACCDNANFTHAALELPACHAACSLLHGKKRDAPEVATHLHKARSTPRTPSHRPFDPLPTNLGVQRRFIVGDILSGLLHDLKDGAAIAGCEATLDRHGCTECCNMAPFSHPDIEKPACHAACGLLGKKRDLIDNLNCNVVTCFVDPCMFTMCAGGQKCTSCNCQAKCV